ncbi:hypothetical protein BDF19DRAFT_466589 [Syncephalis fuscata]|nr:hypothetical protein BDF19DRAFT_466589 [Syncephalis fuscata]
MSANNTDELLVKDRPWLVPYPALETATASITFAGALLLTLRLWWVRRREYRRHQQLLEHLASARNSEQHDHEAPLLSPTVPSMAMSTKPPMPFNDAILSLHSTIIAITLVSFMFLLQHYLETQWSPPTYLFVALPLQTIAWILFIISMRLSDGHVIGWCFTRFTFVAVCLCTWIECASDITRWIVKEDEKEQDPTLAAWAPNGWDVALLVARGIFQTILVIVVRVAWNNYRLSDAYQAAINPTPDDEPLADGLETGTRGLPKPKPNAATNQQGGVGWDEYIQRMRTLLPFMWPKNDLRLQVLIIICGSLLFIGRVVNVMVPMQYKIVVDRLGGSGDTPTFAWKEILWFVGLRFLQGNVGVIATAQTFLWIPVGQYTTREVAIKMFEHLHSLSLRYHMNRKTGEVLRVQDRGVQSIVSLLQAIVFQLVPTLIDIAVACFYFAYTFDLYFASVVLATMSSYIMATIAITDWRMQFRRETNESDNAMEARAVDSLLNFETVKYYGAEKFEVDHSASLNVLNSAQNIIIQTGLLVGCLVCAHRVVVGTMTVGDVVLYLSYITQLYVPLNWFGTYYRMMQRNFIDMEKMLELFEVHVEVQDLPDAAPLIISDGTVEFKNVSFGYDSRQPVLRNLSFIVPGGTTVAFVGASGAGKSTLLRLLFRFYDVDDGCIKIDGQDIRFVRQKDLRANIGVVPQDTVLFNDTIEYNIRYGKVTATDSRVRQAAESAQIHSRILHFPDGYETRVGERGLRLSGGEKQRVAIARTLLKDPPIVLLDEATSALDTHTERNIQSALQQVTKNRTTLIIAHRLSTIVHAEQIFVMEDGQIIESGTHADLMKRTDGHYYDMWMKQLKEESEKASIEASSSVDKSQ